MDPPPPDITPGTNPSEPAPRPPSATAASRPRLPRLCRQERKKLCLEVGAVLLLAVLPHLVRAVASMALADDAASAPLSYSRIVAVATSLQVIAPLLYIMWRSGEPWSTFGIVRPLWSVDLLLAIAVAAAIWGSYLAVREVFYGATFVMPWLGDVLRYVEPSHRYAAKFSGGGELGPLPLLLLWQVVNGFAEELVGRAYLISRLSRLFGRPSLAVLASGALLASYHIYQGSYATLTIFAGQVAVGALYCLVRRIWPFALGHALYDIALHLTRGL